MCVFMRMLFFHFCLVFVSSRNTIDPALFALARLNEIKWWQMVFFSLSHFLPFCFLCLLPYFVRYIRFLLASMMSQMYNLASIHIP